MAGRRLVVEIVGDSKSLERAFKRSSTAGKRFEAQMTGMSRTLGMGGFLSAAGAVGGLALAFRTGFDEMRESRKVAAQTAAAIKSTGGVAGVTAEHISGLADQLMHLSAVDDEVIQSGENVLLTFTNLRNGVSKGSDIFDQATRAALDLSVRMGTDLQSAALQVGKALQDPVRGMTALRRAGVSFTEAQQKTIRRLVESNRLMDAQKLILQELNTEFGGSAAAAGEADGGLTRLQHTVENFLGTVVERLMPAIEQATARLQAWFDNPENIQQVTNEVDKLARAFGRFAQDANEANTEGDKWAKTLQDGVYKVGLGLRAGTLAKLAPFSTWAREERERTLAELDRLGREVKEKIDTIGYGLATAGLRAKDIIEQRTAAGGMLPRTTFEVPEAGGGGKTPAQLTGQRNKWFDANLARQLDRLQDLGLKKQLARLRQLAAEVKARLAVVKDVTYRLKLEDDLLGILRQQRSVQADIVDNIKAANDALKDRADAIKSAVLDRLQRRQTDVLNKRALADAKEQLRLARMIGTQAGIRGATRNLQDVEFDRLRARIEGQTPTLSSAGRFQLGNVITINVHGVTDPAAVARQVTEIMKKRSRRTTTQTRPTAAGQTA